ncbi:uncharacterized protein LOC108905705 [Anoplophora glabripennis]|uniref:uncharacterized protein LOC108905705 n=1 Tax=Anoplophora glabripennis TaxID=217634 RepID=UPI00087413E5|nr:uncharacterized protein LOC108905705 [Anoplophora glabripennis]
MIVAVLLNKIKSFIFVFVNIFRRALCCFRRRRRSSCESVPLTHVVSNSEETKNNFQTWEDWGDHANDRKEKTVQDHIEMYRKQTQILKQSKGEEEPEEQLNFFEDMTPNITKQTKVLISTNQGGDFKQSNRLNFVEDSVNAIPMLELREWEETSGWEGEALDSDAQKVLREKKRLERERRVWEQHQKRQEKMSRSLGSKLST